MYLIVGLGNPGKDYKDTRHNAGFMVMDLLADKLNVKFDRKKFKGQVTEGRIGLEKVILLKPETFMNLSGESLIDAVNFYKIDERKVLVIFDDVSLDVGKIRIRKKGSAGGHNGIKSIVNHLGTENFSRIKVGVGAAKSDLVRHVLGKFSSEEKNELHQALEAARDSVFSIIENGVDSAISEFNGFKPDQEKKL